MGDSEGNTRTFEEMEDDLRCAIDTFFKEMPPLRELVIWGLCDAASAAVFYAYMDPRVTGLILLNPWVRTNEGSAKVYLKHYYASRIFQREFWGKVLSGNFNYSDAARSLAKIVSQALSGKKRIAVNATDRASGRSFSDGLPARMLYGLGNFKGKVLLITSGKDLTAQEFLSLVNSSPEWQKLLDSPRVSRLDFPEANHTFSRRAWRDTVADWTREWIRSW
jgi:exosortase A-associated hydrolase 1